MTSDTSGLVVKEVTSRRDLADYFTSFTAGDVSYHSMLAHYVGEEGHGRAAVFLALNCAAKWKPALLAEFRHEQQRKARRGKGRSVYHFVISRRGGTDPKILAAMAKRLLKLAGLDKQKALIAVHTDTDDNHVHIAVSALNDQGRQIILERGYSKVFLAHVNARLCHEFGYKPEAGLGFHATDDGVYRTEDNARLRDASFCKITNDLRKQPALTARAAAFERETGLPSAQRRIRKFFDRAMGAQSLEMFAAELAVDGITYSLEGSGATIALHDKGFKASRIARSASPKRIAANFGVEHMTAPEAQRLGMTTGAGFYRKDEAGVLQPVRLAKAESGTGDGVLPMRGAVTQYRKHQADERLERAIPEPTKAQADPLRDRIDFLRARPTPVRNWQCERLDRALHYSMGRRGRPRRAQPGINNPKTPDVELRRDSAIILGPTRHTRWNGPPIWSDVRVKKKGALWHVTRGLQPVATFGPGMIVVHQATPDDKEQIIKLAKLDFASDIQTHCKPADRRSWIRAAQSCDVVLGNFELATAQTSLIKERQLRLKDLADRLTAQSQRLIEAGKNVLALTTDSLKKAAPLLDNAHARGRERAHLLSRRLSIQHELIQAASAQGLLDRREVKASVAHSPIIRSVSPSETVPAVAAPPLRRGMKPASIETGKSSIQQPTDWIPTIAEDGTLSWNYPGSNFAVEHGRDQAKRDLKNVTEKTETISSPEIISPTPAIVPLTVSTAKQDKQPNVPAAGRIAAPRMDSYKNGTLKSQSPPPKRETKFEEAVRLVEQLEAVPRMAGQLLSVRLLGNAEWKFVSIPSDGEKIAAAAIDRFISRINAVEEACLVGQISLDTSRSTAGSDPGNHHVVADIRRLMHDQQSVELMQNALQVGARAPEIDTAADAAKLPPIQLVRPTSLTAKKLQEVLWARRRKETRKQQIDAASTSLSEPVDSYEVVSTPAIAPKLDLSEIYKLVAQKSRQLRDWDPEDYGPRKSLGDLKRLGNQNKNIHSAKYVQHPGVLVDGRSF